ncbi:hypothetical protein FOA52_006804 [Chlamydomonas sp. UWO 241]|nr:hypothetical protein FOA52_006804 [Chlamydomonas sp. UWO 241]
MWPNLTSLQVDITSFCALPAAALSRLEILTMWFTHEPPDGQWNVHDPLSAAHQKRVYAR